MAGETENAGTWILRGQSRNAFVLNPVGEMKFVLQWGVYFLLVLKSIPAHVCCATDDAGQASLANITIIILYEI